MPKRSVSGRSALPNLILVLISLAVVLLIVEAALRLFGMANPVIYRPDPKFGYEPKPNQSPNRLGVRIYINDIRLRDDEQSSALLDSNPRVLVVGDSVTYGGSRIAQPDLFTEVLEQELREAQPAVKVLNAGVNGYSVSQMVKRGASLLDQTQPQYLVIYTIRGDFFRPPVQFLAEGNYIYPLEKPSSALIEFLVLSISYIDRRYPIFRFLPSKVAELWNMPENYVPEYDEAKIVDIHFAALEEFLKTIWEPSGRSRSQVVAFVAPNREELAKNSAEFHSELLRKFKGLNIKAYDLTDDFRRGIEAGGGIIDDYYWDFVHYGEKGHALAARAMAKHLTPLMHSPG
ncbi:MAG: SGNH/GDSL hydrolase family protein [Pyrinomonadaceae bacterium]